MAYGLPRQMGLNPAVVCGSKIGARNGSPAGGGVQHRLSCNHGGVLHDPHLQELPGIIRSLRISQERQETRLRAFVFVLLLFCCFLFFLLFPEPGHRAALFFCAFSSPEPGHRRPEALSRWLRARWVHGIWPLVSLWLGSPVLRRPRIRRTKTPGA